MEYHIKTHCAYEISQMLNPVPSHEHGNGQWERLGKGQQRLLEYERDHRLQCVCGKLMIAAVVCNGNRLALPRLLQCKQQTFVNPRQISPHTRMIVRICWRLEDAALNAAIQPIRIAKYTRNNSKHCRGKDNNILEGREIAI